MPELASMMSGPMQGLPGGESKRRPQITIQQVRNGYTIAIPMKASYVARTLDEVLATIRGELTTPDVASVEDGPEGI